MDYAHAIHLVVCDVLCKKKTFDQTDVTLRESSAKTDAEELEEDDCQETEDLRSGISIEHGQNEEQAASQIRSDLVSNVATAIELREKDCSHNLQVFGKKLYSAAIINLKILKVFTCYLIAR